MHQISYKGQGLLTSSFSHGGKERVLYDLYGYHLNVVVALSSLTFLST